MLPDGHLGSQRSRGGSTGTDVQGTRRPGPAADDLDDRGLPQLCVCDITPAFDLSGATISHHLKVLRSAGLVDCERRGTYVYYWIKPDALTALASLLDIRQRAR